MRQLLIGLPRQHKEPGERRDFLPPFISRLERLGFHITLEHDYGSDLNLGKADYLQAAPTVRFGSEEEVYAQDYVLVLRYPREEALRWMHPGACLISMCHYPTRPQRVEELCKSGLEAISMDSLKDDSGRRMVENLRAVAWNGLEVAFQVLQKLYPEPGFESPNRLPIKVTLMGAGAVGGHAVHAAINYGDERLRKRLAQIGVPGVHMNVIDYDLTNQPIFLQEILSRTDILIDATQRLDPTRPIIPNTWIAYLPEYAVLLDLSADPYDCTISPAFVKGIEGIPQGNLDQYIFTPDDPAYDHLPECVGAHYRRHVVSCYSWPGIHPQECMQVYGHQLQPVLRKLAEKEGIGKIDPDGTFFERAIARAQLSRWTSSEREETCGANG